MSKGFTKSGMVTANNPHVKFVIAMMHCMQEGHNFTIARSIDKKIVALPLEDIGLDYVHLSFGIPKIKITYILDHETLCEEATKTDLILFTQQAKMMSIQEKRRS